MSKSFLLSKLSVLALTAIVLHSLAVPAWSIKRGSEEGQEINPAKRARTITMPMNEKNNGERSITSTQEKNTSPFQDLPLELKALILEMAAFDIGADNKSLSNLALVCTDWNDNIVKNETYGINISMKKAFWRGVYNITNPQDIADFERFYKGSLIYRPIPESDEGMIKWSISDLSNPLEGKFDLSQLGSLPGSLAQLVSLLGSSAHLGSFEQALSISTGYRKGLLSEYKNKAELFFTPRFLVNTKIPPSHHVKVVSDQNWDASKAPVGVFFTHEADIVLSRGMGCCWYFTAESMGELGSENLFEKCKKSEHVGNIKTYSPVWWCAQHFHISFAN